MHHVIVGAGPAGMAALETLRALDASARLTLVCDEAPQARMVLPYLLSGRIEEASVLTADAAHLAELRVETLLGARVIRVEPKAHRLELADGRTLDYDRLLVATGSSALRPPVEGVEGSGVTPLWTLAQSQQWLRAPHEETLIVGAGFIAFTVLDALVEASRRVRFVEQEPQVLPRMLDAAAARVIEGRLAKRGIEVHTGSRVAGIREAGARRRVTLERGEPIEADSVVLATGVRPNLELLEGSGIETDHGIRVDAHLRTSVPDVYAAGDVAAGPDLLGGPARVQAIQPTAVDHGRVAAANMAGHPVAYSGSLTLNVVAAQGLQAASFGRWDENDDVTAVESPASESYRKYVWRDDVLIGGILVGPNAAVAGVNDLGMLKGLIQTGVRLGPWRRWLEENPLDLRRAYVASGAARELLGHTLLAGHASSGGGFRFPALPARRTRSAHHATLVRGAPA